MELSRSQYMTPPQPPQASDAKDTIDPRNAFNNPTENRDYNRDYTEIVPQIALPGCQLPVLPSDEEKKNIRKQYNIAGGGLLLHCVMTNALATILYLVIALVLRMTDQNAGPLPGNYDALQSQYLSDSSITMALNLGLFLFCNMLVFFIGCRWSKIKVASLFQTKNLKAPTLLRYMLLGLFIQFVSAVLASYAEDVAYYLLDKPLYSPDFSTNDNLLKTVATVLSVCVVAPITEELLYRGFFLKTMSRVSQRFGIFMSALFFALAHENIAQGILTFFLGILLGYVTTKHDSLVPAIVVHFTINTFSMSSTLISQFAPSLLNAFSMLAGMVILFGGLAMLIYTLICERLPDNTPHQSIRSGRIACSAICLWLTAGIHLILSLAYILQS